MTMLIPSLWVGPCDTESIICFRVPIYYLEC